MSFLLSSCRFISTPPRSSWRLTPKQDFLVCFFAGNLLLGATRSGGLEHDVSVPPRPEELTEVGRRDWTTGIELLRTCIATHDTKTFVPSSAQINGFVSLKSQRRGLAPEIAHFRIPSDKLHLKGVLKEAPGDWYIKGAGYGSPPHFGLTRWFAYRYGSTTPHSVGEFPPYDARYMLRCVVLLPC